MDELNKQLLLTAVRHLLTGIGAALVARGMLDNESMAEIVGAIVAITSICFALYHRKGAHEELTVLKESNSALRQTISDATSAPVSVSSEVTTK